MRNFFLIASLSALAAACGGKQSTDQPTSQPTDIVEEVVEAATASVRFVHASNAGPIRVYAGDVQLTSEAVGTGQWIARSVAPAGEHTLQFKPSGGGEPFATVDTEFGGDASYTVIFAGIANSVVVPQAATGFVVEDDLSAPAAGQARVRFFHAVPTAGDVITSSGEGRGYAAGLGYGTMSRWYDVSPSDNTVVIGLGGEIALETRAPLTDGMLTTVLILEEGGSLEAKFINEPGN